MRSFSGLRLTAMGFCLLCFVPAASAESCDLVELFRSTEPILNATTITELAPADAAVLGWRTSQVLLGYILMFEATGEREYLDDFLLLADQTWSVRGTELGIVDSERGAPMPAWSSTRYSGGKPTIQTVLTGMISYPLAYFVYLQRTDPSLADLEAKADRYLAWLEETMAIHEVEWRDGPYPDEGSEYLYGTEMMTSINRVHSTGRTYLMLALVTGEEKYRAKTEKIARYFHRRITWRPDGTVDWGHFMPDPLGRPPWDEDISHAGASVDFAALCAQHGFVFTREDILGFVKTFREKVMLDDGTFASTVAGNLWDKRWGLATALRWGRILQFDPSLAEELAPMVCEEYGAKGRMGPGIPYLLLAGKAEREKV